VVNASKGIEPGTLLTLGGVLGQELPGHRGRLFALSGPSFAREVARGKETAMVLAGPALGRAALRRALESPAVQIEETSDRVGVELGGSLKNVLAIGCGILDGLECGANTKAAFVSRGLAEMAALAAKAGGRRETIYGLSGLGDLVATGTSHESRNRTFGEKLGRGKTLTQALGEIPTVIEGIEAAASARALARKLGLRTPLMAGVWRIVHGNAKPGALLGAMGFGGAG
jgi:glycerol-3-phosphate dehydrogenase (NAD(P)+)